MSQLTETNVGSKFIVDKSSRSERPTKQKLVQQLNGI